MAQLCPVARPAEPWRVASPLVADEQDDTSPRRTEADVQRLALDLIRAWIDNKPARWTALVTQAHNEGPREVVEALGGTVEMLLSRIATRAGSREMMEVLADQVALLLVRISHQIGSTPKATLDTILAESTATSAPSDEPGPPPSSN